MIVLYNYWIKVKTCSYSAGLKYCESIQDSCIETDIDFIYSYHSHAKGRHS